MKTDDEATVRALLAAAGIDPPEDELAAMVASYRGMRAAADALYTDDVDRFLPVWLPTDADHEAR